MTTPTATWHIRPIDPRDDARVASLIRDTLTDTEFDCGGPGFALHDAEVDRMHANYQGADRRYYVVELDGEVQGCGGFAPLDQAPEGRRIAEVRKMYFDPSLRGRGAGRALLARILDDMRRAGFDEVYLETSSRMARARALYERFGFDELTEPWGATGHTGCDRFYARRLDPA